MRWFILLALVVLLVFRPMCGSTSCYDEGDCDDGNECTSDLCRSMRWSSAPYEFSCFGDDGWSYWCEHDDVDDGTPCEVDGQTGVCEAGECRLDGETLDGGV
jgi:hypothetical protein